MALTKVSADMLADGAGGGGTTFDPTVGDENPALFDDFLAQRDGLLLGKLGWVASLGSGSNALNRALAGTETNRAGVLQMTHGSGSGIISSISLATDSVYLGASAITLAAAVKIGTVPDGTDNTRFTIGLTNNANPVSVTAGVHFDVFYATNTTNWLCTTESASTATQSDTSTAFDTSWVNLRLEINADASEVKGYINGTLVATNTTNIPTGAALGPVIAIRNDLGTSTNTLDIDWFYMNYAFGSARGTF